MPENISSQFNRVFAFPIETNRSVNSVLDRDNIPGGVRWEGMHVYVAQDGEQKTYELRGGLTNDFWEPISDINIDVAVDAAFSETSTNPVQNQVITNGMYQRTQLQTPGQAQVHWDNITNAPNLSDYQLLSQKATDFSTINNTLYPTTQAVADYVSGATDNAVLIGDTGNTLPNTDDPDTITGSTLTYSSMDEVGAPTWATVDGMVLTGRRRGIPVDRQLWVGRLGEIGLRGGTGGGGYNEPWIQIATQNWVNDQAFLTEETDPTVPAYVKAITQANITNWDTAFGWGNHALAGYVPETRTLGNGLGINVIGDLSQNRTVSLDFDYLDNRYSEGFKQHPAVRVATTGNITLSGLQTIDGVALASGYRVLVKNQTAAADNGIYVAASGAWTRASDFDEGIPTEVEQGASVFVDEGTLLAKTGWTLETPDPITVGTTPLSFIQYAGANNYTGGDLITIDGNQINHDPGSWTSKTNLSGATVVSNLAVDAFGHPTDWTTRELTAADIGAITEADISDRLPFVENGGPTFQGDVDTLGSSWTYVSTAATNDPTWATSDGAVLTMGGNVNRQLWVGRLGEIGLRGGTGSTAYTDEWIQLATRNWVNGQGFLTSFTETDPVFSASPASGIAATDINTWNSALQSVQPGTNVTIDNTDPNNPIISASGGIQQVNWGDISGTLSNQTDLQNSLNAKENIENKSINFSTINDTLYPSLQAVNTNFFSQNSSFSNADAGTYLNVDGLAVAVGDIATGFPSSGFATLIAGFGVGTNPQLWMPHTNSDTNRPQYRVVSSAGTETWNELAYLSDIPTGSVQTLGFTNGQLSISGGNSVNLDSRYYTETEADSKFLPFVEYTGFAGDVNTLESSWTYVDSGATNRPTWATTTGAALTMGGSVHRQLWIGRLGEIGLRGAAVPDGPYTDDWIQLARMSDIPTVTTPTLQQVTTAGRASDTGIVITGSGSFIDGLNLNQNNIYFRELGATNGFINSQPDFSIFSFNGSTLRFDIEGATLAGIASDTRVSGSPAINIQDFINGNNAGFGMSWNNMDSVLDWGEYDDAQNYHYIPFDFMAPDGVFSIGDGLNDSTKPRIMTYVLGANRVAELSTGISSTQTEGSISVLSGAAETVVTLLSRDETNEGILTLRSTQTDDAKMNLSSGNFQIQGDGNGIILNSPDGTQRALIHLDNSGVLQATPI